ncbi:MAG: pyridoxine 4-dehydrogenase [Thermoleophilaceae bacterium]|nr:pyridoxine 4-dehydrogenase [Thermoleophilaceae bacterium]
MSVNSYDIGGRSLNRMGFGAMQLPGPGVWGPPRDREMALAVLRRAVEQGVNHIDTAQYYGPDVANELIREALHPYPDDLFIVTKVGALRGDDRSWHTAAEPAELRAAIEDNLRSLDLERIHNVHYRVMPGADVDAGLGELATMRDEGKIEHIGISNADSAQIERALELTPLVSVQNKLSVLDREFAAELELCRERGLAFVPFFPLGSAFQGGPAKLAENEVLQRIAAAHEATPAQVALAWLLEQGEHVLLIPGTSSLVHLEENMAASDLELSPEELVELDALA